MVSVPNWRKQLRWASIGHGLLIFFWLGPEDNRVWHAALIGSGLAILLAFTWLHRRFSGLSLRISQVVPLLTLLGVLTGGGASLITALLMLFKNARHAHLVPDYPPALMGAILQLAPAWGLVGGLLGLGTALLWISATSDWTKTTE